MKITLKISSQQLNTLVHAFNSLSMVLINDARHVKVSRSILDKVVLRLRKKYLETQQTATLFAKKKKVSFSFEYYEAHYLEEFVSIMVNHPLSEYDRNVLRYIQTNLHQQLA